jgi:uncharacterized protein YjbI with pentapeptide repeats
LSNADFSNANLSDAHLVGANLSDANLRMADLSDAKLSLYGADEAHMRDTNLSDANLRGAWGLTDEQITAAESLEGATMPDGSKHNSQQSPSLFAKF